MSFNEWLPVTLTSSMSASGELKLRGTFVGYKNRFW